MEGPDIDNYKNHGQCIQYLCDNAHLPLTLEADQSNIAYWWIDASYATHPDMKSHTGAMMTMGCGAVQSLSLKQWINTQSSTKAELVGVNDAMVLVLWT